jgi:hypothetical protein
MMNDVYTIVDDNTADDLRSALQLEAKRSATAGAPSLLRGFLAPRLC